MIVDIAQLSWDLHLHPGSPAEDRWGDGPALCHAARAAGVRGFVWKSHTAHTVDSCRAINCQDVIAIPSVILNPWADKNGVIDGLDAGAPWLWGPSRDSTGGLGWDLNLPSWWPDVRARLPEIEHPILLATSHLGRAGRCELAETANELRHVICSVTHSLYIDVDEARDLAGAGCVFELDFYTSAFPPKGRPLRSLADHAVALKDTGATVYLTSDAGQKDTGNPFSFAADQIAKLASRLDAEALRTLVDTGPAAIATWAIGHREASA